VQAHRKPIAAEIEDENSQMNFFNIDLHISVIADLKEIFRDLGHEITSWSISSHTWIFGERPAKVDIINQHNWREINPAMCDAFYERYKEELEIYDGFVVTFAPCFAMLFKKWRKPIIIVTPIRYEAPFSADRKKWEHFNEFLRGGIDSGIVIPIANNKYDAAYAQLFTQRKWRVIPSLCEYTNSPYSGRKDSYLYSSRFKDVALPKRIVDKDRAFKRSFRARLLRKFSIYVKSIGYSWADLAEFKGIIHIPYNCSVMSIFEQYSANIPLLFPSHSFMAALHKMYSDRGVLSELSWNQIFGLPSSSIIPCGINDPNNYADASIAMEWMRLADFYDSENMPYIQYFNSFEHLEEITTSLDAVAISNLMFEFNEKRRPRVHKAWTEVIEKIQDSIACN
jgi:hypothetical protein